MRNDQLVQRSAARFRGALQAAAPRLAERSLALYGLLEFPLGACLDASLMLADYLEHCGLGEWTCVAGERPYKPAMPQSHAWLERDGLIVDITADQFNDCPGPAVWVTRDRGWHAQFGKIEDRGRLWRPQDDELLDAYAELRDAADHRLPDDQPSTRCPRGLSAFGHAPSMRPSGKAKAA